MRIPVRLSPDEISSLCSCINEALDALGDDEFEARVGIDRATARALLGRLTDYRARAKRDNV